MGLAVWLKTMPLMHLPISRAFRWLAVFGIANGIYQWMLLYRRNGIDSEYFDFLTTNVAALSYLALAIFAIRIVDLPAAGTRVGNALRQGVSLIPYLLFSVWLALHAGWHLIQDFLHGMFPALDHLTVQMLPQYILAAPSAALAAIGFARLSPFGAYGRRVQRHAQFASFFFVNYAALLLFSGAADIYQAEILNDRVFTAVVGIPIDILRAVAALGIGYCVVSALTLFDKEERAELDRRIEKATTALDVKVAELEQALADREVAQNALQENEEKLAAVFDNVPVGLSLRDTDGRFTLINRHWTGLINLERGDVLGRHVSELAPPERAARYIENDRRVLETGETIVDILETPFLAAQSRTVVVTVFPIRRGTEITGLGTILIDISDRKAAEKKLAEQATLLRTVLDTVPALVVVRDSDLRITYANRQAEKHYGWSNAQLVGKTMADMFGAERAAVFEDFQSRALQLDAGRALTDPDYHPLDQAEKIMWLRAAPVVADNGEKRGIVTVAVDVSDLKNAERKLQESEALLQAMLDHIPGVIGMRGIDGRYLVLGAGCQDWYRMPRERMIGKRPDEIWPEDWGKRILLADQEIVRNDKPSVQEEKVLFPDGVSRSVRVNRFPVRNSDNALRGIGFLVSDISAEKRAEEQLRQAQKMEAVGQLTGGIAHDFNNLLGIIIGNLDFIEESLAPSSELHNIVTSATTAALQGATLNKQLLAFSRKQDLAPGPLNLNERIPSMVTILQRSLPETIEIHIRQSPDLWPCIADASQVESALLNLVLNARDAMPVGGELSIETANFCIGGDGERPDMVPGDYAVLSVSDTGSGMTEDAIEHAFEPFFTTKPVGQGSGLGLSMIYGFAKQSGGHVTIDRTPGRGTTVRLYLPRHVTEDAAPAVRPATRRLDRAAAGD
jgi:PAS domain S-box-containing protein